MRQFQRRTFLKRGTAGALSLLVDALLIDVLPAAGIVGIAGIAGAAAPVRAQALPPPRQRLEDFVIIPGRLAALKRGVAVMKSRRPSDPTSWFYQAAVHAVAPQAIQEALARDPGVTQVDQARFWNQCPHGSNRNSADFLIWHRAYLFHFERLLREAAGDPDLSLPYWNYTDPAQRGFPEAFADTDPDPRTDAPRNPLYEPRREQPFMFGLYELSEATAGTLAIYSENEFFGATEDTGFAGGVADRNSRTRGRIERQPHDLIHFAIGGAVRIGEDSSVGLMASVPTAAFDPVFWVHHANVDRLWTLWECADAAPRRWGRLPAADWLQERPWHFHDAGGQVVNLPRAHYLERRNLQTRYDTDRADCRPLQLPASSGNAAAEGPLAVGSHIRSFVTVAVAGERSGAGRIAPDAVQVIDVPLDGSAPLPGGSLRAALRASTPAAPLRAMLEIEDLHIEGVTSVGFDVYIDLPDAAAPDRASEAYVGTVSMVGALPGELHDHAGGAAQPGTGGPAAHAHMQDPKSQDHGNPQAQTNRPVSRAPVQTFDMSRIVLGNLFDPARVRVRIVPFDLLAPRGGRARIRRAAGLTHGRMRVLLMAGSTRE